MDILYKPNPFIEGIFNSDKTVDFIIFNKILCNLQKTSKMNYHIATVELEEFQNLIKSKNLSTPKGVFYYLKNTFQKEILIWKENSVIKSVALITKIEYNEIDKKFNIYIDEDIVNATINYKEINKNKKSNEKKIGTTPINLELLGNSRNFYAHRLYEMLRQWSDIKRKTFTVSELKEKLLIGDKYSSYYEFKRRVLNPSVNKINDNFNMNVKFIEEKKGKNISTIIFIMNDLEPRKYNFKSGSPNKDTDLRVKQTEVIEVPSGYNAEDINIRLLVSYNVRISVNTLKLKQEEYGEEAFIKAIKILEDRVQDEQQDKLKAPVRYLTGILDNLKNKENEEIAPQVSKAPAKKSNFANFTQREYDYDKLENQLLGLYTVDDEDE